MEIAYHITRAARVMKVYDWYEVQDRRMFNGNVFWDRVFRSYVRERAIQRLEND